jgi:hypothetical protein
MIDRLPQIRHCERSEAIQTSIRGFLDCFAALAMTTEISMSARTINPQ